MAAATAGLIRFPSRKIARGGGSRFFRELIAPGLADRTRTTVGQFGFDVDADVEVRVGRVKDRSRQGKLNR